MPHLTINLSCPLHDSFRVRQVIGMFDMPDQPALSERFTVELPTDSEPWQIGVIVGPSGSGKTAVARKAYGRNIYAGSSWPADRAVIDCFGDRPIRDITRMLSLVGFSSPPSWIKPYAVLSNGEKFRCELARALLGDEQEGREDAVTRGRGEEKCVKAGRLERERERARANEAFESASFSASPCHRVPASFSTASSSTNSPAWSIAPSPASARRRYHGPFEAGRSNGGGLPARATPTSCKGSSRIGCSTWPRKPSAGRRFGGPFDKLRAGLPSASTSADSTAPPGKSFAVIIT